MECSEHNLKIQKICFNLNCNETRLLCTQCEQAHPIDHLDFLKKYENVFNYSKEIIYLKNQYEPLHLNNQQLLKEIKQQKQELGKKIKIQYEKLEAIIKQVIKKNFEIMKDRINEYFKFLENILADSLSIMNKNLNLIEQFNTEIHQFYKQDIQNTVKSHFFSEFINEAVQSYNTLDQKVFSKVRSYQQRCQTIFTNELPLINDNNLKEIKKDFATVLQKFPICMLSQSQLTEFSLDNIIQLSCAKKYEAHSDWVNCLCQIQPNIVASGSADGIINIWNISTFKDIISLHHLDSVNCMQFIIKKNNLISCSSDKTIKQWDPFIGHPLIHTYTGHDKAVKTIQLINDQSQFASAGNDLVIKIWDYISFQNIFNLNGHFESIFALQSLPDNSLASGGLEKIIKIWSLLTQSPRLNLQGHKETITTLQYMKDQRTIVSGSQDYTLKVWNFITGDLIRTLELNQGTINALIYVNLKDIIIVGSWDTTIKAINVKTGQLLITLQEKENYVQSLLYLNDGKTLLSGSGDKNIRIWTIKELKKDFENQLGIETKVSQIDFKNNDQNTIKQGSCQQCLIF